MKILVIEDDGVIRSLVERVLQNNGYETIGAGNAHAGEQEATQQPFDCIILDLALPDKNGIEVCRSLREHQIDTPILILSAHGETERKVAGLNTGADDYLTKPFDNQELLARIEAITRRKGESDGSVHLSCGELHMNLVSREFEVNGNRVSLTNNEFDLLAHLMKHKDQVVTKEELTRGIWDIDFETHTNFLNVYISYLRKKISEHTDRTYIQTIRKQGFRLLCQEHSVQQYGSAAQKQEARNS